MKVDTQKSAGVYFYVVYYENAWFWLFTPDFCGMAQPSAPDIKTPPKRGIFALFCNKTFRILTCGTAESGIPTATLKLNCQRVLEADGAFFTKEGEALCAALPSGEHEFLCC